MYNILLLSASIVGYFPFNEDLFSVFASKKIVQLEFMLKVTRSMT